MRRGLGILFVLLALCILIADIVFGVRGQYQYNRDIKAYWNLAEKASSIPLKTQYVDKFVEALNNSGLAGEYDVLMLKTPNNSFDRNLEMLQSLQTRLHEIQTMDVRSPEYQWAIQQITGQEQGEANAMVRVFHGCWFKKHYPFLWKWGLMLNIIVGVVGFATVGAVLLGKPGSLSKRTV